MRTELTPTNGRKSFNGKAKVEIHENGSETLFSYGTPIISLKNGVLTRHYEGYTSTTGNHIISFCGLHKKEYLNVTFMEYDEYLKKI